MDGEKSWYREVFASCTPVVGIGGRVRIMYSGGRDRGRVRIMSSGGRDRGECSHQCLPVVGIGGLLDL